MYIKDLIILGNEGANSFDTTSFLLKRANNTDILIDASLFTIKKIKDVNYIDNISTLIISHSHMDHIGGILEFIKYKLEAKQPINLIGGNDFYNVLNKLGLDNLLKSIGESYKKNLELLNIENINNSNFLKENNIQGFQVLHVEGNNEKYGILETYGFSIKNKFGKHFIISGDTKQIIDSKILKEELSLSFNDVTYIFQDVGETGSPNPGIVHAKVEDILEKFNDNPEFFKKYRAIHVNLHLMENFNEIRLAEVGEIYNLENLTNLQIHPFDNNLSIENKLILDEENFIENNSFGDNIIEDNILINPTPEFLLKLSQEYLEADNSNKSKSVISNINTIDFTNSYRHSFSVIIELFLIQKRYYEGLRFYGSNNRKRLDENLPFYELGIKFVSSDKIIIKTIKEAISSIGLRVDNQFLNREDFLIEKKILKNKLKNKSTSISI